MNIPDCPCLDCKIDRARYDPQYVALLGEGLFYVRDEGPMKHTANRDEATRFGPTHIKIFGKHLTPELVTE